MTSPWMTSSWQKTTYQEQTLRWERFKESSFIIYCKVAERKTLLTFMLCPFYSAPLNKEPEPKWKLLAYIENRYLKLVLLQISLASVFNLANHHAESTQSALFCIYWILLLLFSPSPVAAAAAATYWLDEPLDIPHSSDGRKKDRCSNGKFCSRLCK